MKFKKILISIIVCTFTFFLVNTNVFAVDVQNRLKDVPVTEEYTKWEELSNNRNIKYIPKKYDIGSFSSSIGSSNNPYYVENVLQYANLPKFSLRDIIPENVVIRNQGKENSCWAFSTIACLESNLALKNKQKGNSNKVYDFSEQYMVSGSFYDNYLNGQINKKGLNIKPYVGGNFNYRAIGHVMSGNGVVDEESYPYLNSEEPVDINSLSNKKITADILDTVVFGSSENEEEFLKLKKSVKEHIVQNGGVYVAMKMSGIGDYKFNPVNGSVYNDVKILSNHAVTIIGWDDNYSKENFNVKPNNNGAWIAKNSYGDHLEQDINELKSAIYDESKEHFNSNGIYSATDIDDNHLVKALNVVYKQQMNIEPVKLVQGKDGKKYCSIDFNTGGYLYISYEDKTLSDYNGIVRAIEKKDYDNIYQNFYYMSGVKELVTNNDKNGYGILLGQQYEAKSIDEKLVKFSIMVPSEADYEFYANIEDNSMDMNKLLKLELDNFSTKIHLNPGYHTIYLKEPLKLNSKKFAVATKVSNTNLFYVAVGNTNDSNLDWFKYNKPSNNSYFGIVDGENNIQLERMDNLDFTLRAYTRENVNVNVDDNIDKNDSINDSKANEIDDKIKSELKKNSIKSAEVKMYYDKNNKSIRINNINPYIGESKYEFSIIMKDDTNDSNSVLIDKNGVNTFKFSSSDLKKDVNNTYYYEFNIGDNIKNLDDLKRYKVLNLNLKEYVDGNVNERNINVELVNMDNIDNLDKSLINDDAKKNFVDNTVVKGRLPQTGESILILVIISGLLVPCIIYKIYVGKIK